MLEEACQQARKWHDQHSDDPPLTMCVNLSAEQFRMAGLDKEITRVLREVGLEASSLSVETTEGVAMEDADANTAMLWRLKESGVRLAIDDFGTGYSSLSYLRRFPVDGLKIDRSFIAELGEDPRASPLVKGIVSLAQALGLDTIAEGVEYSQQLAILREIGCDYAQGYYFAEPLPAEAASELLTKGFLP